MRPKKTSSIWQARRKQNVRYNTISVLPKKLPVNKAQENRTETRGDVMVGEYIRRAVYVKACGQIRRKRSVKACTQQALRQQRRNPLFVARISSPHRVLKVKNPVGKTLNRQEKALCEHDITDEHDDSESPKRTFKMAGT
jgi:hypothetical protein